MTDISIIFAIFFSWISYVRVPRPLNIQHSVAPTSDSRCVILKWSAERKWVRREPGCPPRGLWPQVQESLRPLARYSFGLLESELTFFWKNKKYVSSSLCDAFFEQTLTRESVLSTSCRRHTPADTQRQPRARLTTSWPSSLVPWLTNFVQLLTVVWRFLTWAISVSQGASSTWWELLMYFCH